VLTKLNRTYTCSNTYITVAPTCPKDFSDPEAELALNYAVLKQADAKASKVVEIKRGLRYFLLENISTKP